MARVRLLAVVLILSVGLMSVGYAASAAEITVSGTMSTNSLSVSCDMGTVKGSPGTIVSQERTSEQKVTFSVGNFYPGASVGIDLTARNTGSLSVTLRSVELNLVGADPALLQHLYLYGWYEYPGSSSSSVKGQLHGGTTPLLLTGLAEKMESEWAGVTFAAGQTLSLLAPPSGTQLPNGEVADSGLIIYFSPDAGNETQGKILEFNLSLHWEESNTGVQGVVVESGVLIGKQGEGTQNFEIVVVTCGPGPKKTATIKSQIKNGERYVDLSVKIDGKVHQLRLDRDTIEGFPLKKQ